ncbi:MAG: M14 family zinc carboxypeptidase [Holophagaceae bacterium]
MRRSLAPVLALSLLLPAALGAVSPPTPTGPALWEAWPTARVSPADPWGLKHSGLRVALADLQARHPGLITLVEEGTSAEGRQIPLLRLGSGPTGVLLWSQMHGDEPTATSALLDLMHWLGTRPQDPAVQRVLSRLTLWVIPMLNPDGAERTQRWNAQGLDINRDALRLSSPEGRFLKAVRDRVQPTVGYNLHNQNPHLRAGATGTQVALSLLSVPGDEAFSVTPGIRQTRRLAVAVDRLVQPLAQGRVARYDTDYTARAFGDSMTRWGTPTLLIETGGWAGLAEAERLVRLNFVALAGSLSALADGSLAAVDDAAYDRIPFNQRDATAALVVRHVRLASGRGLAPFAADLSFLLPGPFAGERPRLRQPVLTEVGDLAHVLGLADLDGTGLLAVPWPAPEGTDWPALKTLLASRKLDATDEATLLAAVQTKGEAAVAGPGFTGAVLLYRTVGDRVLLAGAVLRGRVVGLELR